MRTSYLFVIVATLLLVGGLAWWMSIRNIEPTQVTYASQAECETATNKRCDFMMCDIVPEGKTYEETCGKSPKGWIPLNEPLSAQTVYQTKAECESITGRRCSFFTCGDTTVPSAGGFCTKPDGWYPDPPEQDSSLP